MRPENDGEKNDARSLSWHISFAPALNKESNNKTPYFI